MIRSDARRWWWFVVVSLAWAPGCSDEDNGDNSDGGAGKTIICEAADSRCLGDTLRSCSSDGTAWKNTDCKAAGKRCLSINQKAQCTALVCDPDTFGCAADGLTTRKCATDGKSWKTGKVCQRAKGELCYSASGTCQNACKFEALDRQNVGCVFYPVNLENDNPDIVGVAVANPNPVSVNVTLAGPAGTKESKSIAAGKLYTFKIPAGRNVLKGTGTKKLAYKLTSDFPVAAYQFSPYNKAQQRSNDASVLVAKPALGKLYYGFSAPVTQSDSRTYITVVGSEANTKVTITPSADTSGGGGIPAIKEGESHTVTIGEQEVVQLATSKLTVDLTSTKIRADKPVAVFGGNTCAQLPAGKAYCDHIQEQMFPVETWSRKYMAVKFMPRGKQHEDDWWRIMASKDNTTVTLSGAGSLPTVPKLKAGEYFQVATSYPFLIEADKPVAVAHYALGEQEVRLPLDRTVYTEDFQTPNGCTRSPNHGNMGDPALAVAVPLEQFRKDYFFLTPDTYRYDFVTVLLPKRTVMPDVVVDGKLLPVATKEIGGTGYRYARFRVEDGPHLMKADAPFGIDVYGYDCNVSYGYSGGQNMKTLNPID